MQLNQDIIQQNISLFLRGVSDRAVFVERLKLKGEVHVAVNKPAISRIYIVDHTWPLCSVQILVDGVNPLESYFQKSTSISPIVQHMSVSFVSLRRSRVHFQNNAFILRKIMENHCDMADQKYCKIVVSKEVLFTLRDPAPLSLVQ